MNAITPQEIKLNKQSSELFIVWNDGHFSTYTFSLLRHACPCAQCRRETPHSPEPPQEVFFMPVEDNPSTHLLNIEKVGAYALTPGWEDGHHFGIYSWPYLRALCPCPICREMMIYGQ